MLHHVITNKNLEALPTIVKKPSESYLEYVYIDSESLRKHLSSLNPLQSYWPDNMHPDYSKNWQILLQSNYSYYR